MKDLEYRSLKANVYLFRVQYIGKLQNPISLMDRTYFDIYHNTI